MLISVFLFLIFIRPFIPSLSYPSFDTYFSLYLIIVSLALIIKKITFGNNLNVRDSSLRSELPQSLSEAKGRFSQWYRLYTFLYHKSKREIGKGFSGQGCLFLFFLAVVLSAFLSFHPYKGLQELAKFISYFFVFYVAYYADNLEKKKIILTLILSASCVSLYAIYWFYFGSLNLLGYMKEQRIVYPFVNEFLGRRRAFMPYVLPSALAGYLIMILPLSLAYLFHEKKRGLHIFSLKNILLSFSGLFIVIALILTKSAGAFLSIFLSLLIFMILSRLINEKTFLVLSILLLAFMSISILRSFKAEYFTSSVFSIQNRLIFWRNTLLVILKHPFRGTGLGNLPFVGSKFAHNSYLQIWAEMGILGIVAFLGFIYKSLKAIQPKKLATDKLYASLVIASFGFLIHNFIDFSFFLPEVSIFWWIIIGLLFFFHQQPPR